MAVFKCKMCGGDLDVREGMSIGTCQFCGSTMTLPRLDDDRKANLYDRANHFRRNNEYDKAASLYEMILNEDKTDAEAYWSLVLCKYGIVYVEDPATRKRIPTCNRTQFTSIFTDENYKQAIAHADARARTVYEAEAANIDAIQKGILAISSREEPFDVFICYKEQDAKGNRTPDSVLAQDLYYQLGAQGFRVFFARITLEDKIGTAYEPYIFAALQSAKIMVVLGTSPEHFNAPWVKNEWSRFLSLIRDGGSKMLVPAYRDMDPYDLPADFSHLQALDMSKLGFMQDLVRGIQKILQKPAQSVVAPPQAVPDTNTVEPLLKRAFMFISDGDFKNAAEYCERVLDRDPENSRAYIGKLLIELRLNDEKQLIQSTKPIHEYDHFQKALDFADPQYKLVLDGYKLKVIDNLDRLAKERTQKRELKFKETREKVIKNLQKSGIFFAIFVVLLALLGNANRTIPPAVVVLPLTISFVLALYFGAKVTVRLIALGSLSDIKKFLFDAELGRMLIGVEDNASDEETDDVIAEIAVESSPSNATWERSRIPKIVTHKKSSPGGWQNSDFSKYITPPFRQWSQFDGRSSRKEFVFFIVINFCIFGATFYLSKIIPYFYIVRTIYGWVMLVPLFSLWIRRLHDMGRSGIMAISLPLLQLLLLFHAMKELDIYYQFNIPVHLTWLCIQASLRMQESYMDYWLTPTITIIVTVAFLLLLLYSMIIPGQRRKNRYGPAPLSR